MDKYQAVSILNICQILYLLGILFLVGYFKNYWLLFLILTASIDTAEKRLLGIKENKYE